LARLDRTRGPIAARQREAPRLVPPCPGLAPRQLSAAQMSIALPAVDLIVKTPEVSTVYTTRPM